MDYVEKLTAIRNDGVSERSNCESLNCMVDSIKSEMCKYKEIIPEFFSSRGEAGGIRNMYAFMEEHPHDLRTVPVIDLCKAANIYKEYVEGMLTFIKEVFSKEPTGNEISDYESKIKMASENNDSFVASLFGGNMNESKRKTLREASENIEYLINFREDIDNFVNIAESLKPPYQEGALGNLAKDSVGLYFNSVSCYCFSVIKCVFTTYDAICEAIKYPYGRPVAPEVPKYQLF